MFKFVIEERFKYYFGSNHAIVLPLESAMSVYFFGKPGITYSIYLNFSVETMLLRYCTSQQPNVHQRSEDTFVLVNVQNIMSGICRQDSEGCFDT